MAECSVSEISATSIAKHWRPKTALAVKDMYATINENSNFEWESINYKVPAQYHSVKSPKKNNPQKDAKRSSYLDEVQLLGKKVPGVGKYDVDLEDRKSFSKWDGKSPKRKTLFVDTYEKNMRCPTPGPASYFLKESKSQSHKALGHARNNSMFAKISYLDEVEYLGCSSPGTGQYNVSTNILKPSFRNNKANRPASSSKIKRKPAKMSEINPVTDGTFAKIQFTKKDRPQSGLKKCTFGRDRRFKVDKQQSLVPGPNKYNNERCVNSTLIKSRSIYY